jgi:D-sedoheptulose 7-phosphate isomerase
MFKDYIKTVIESSLSVKRTMLEDTFIEKINSASQILLSSFKNNGRAFFAGNGGSAADAQHLAAEFVSRFEFDRPGLPSISLSTDTSMLTAISNDYGYEKLFSRQLEAQGKKDDVFIGITTSGKSPNILKGFEAANKIGMKTIALVGENGIDNKNIHIDAILNINSLSTARIQECHITIGHILCGIVEKEIFKEYKPNN